MHLKSHGTYTLFSIQASFWKEVEENKSVFTVLQRFSGYQKSLFVLDFLNQYKVEKN